MTRFFAPSVALMMLLMNNSFANDNTSKKLSKTNPFYEQSTLPYQTIPFDKIKDSDFEPAFEEGMKQHLHEIKKIADNPKPATFENTLVEMEKSGVLLNRVRRAFNVLASANTNKDLQALQERVAPKLAAHSDAIYLNANLFKRVESLYNRKDKLGLDQESKRLIEVNYDRFVLAGARLSEKDKAELKKLNEEEAALSAKFNNQLLNGTKSSALLVKNESALRGLSDAERDAAAKAAKANGKEGQWLIALQNTTQQPKLPSLQDRETRRKLFMSSWTRTEHGDENDTRNTITRLAQIRAQKAKLIGFDNYAAWNLQNQMAKTPEAVASFFDQLVPAATAKAKQEAADIQALINSSGENFKLEPWDWDFYAEQVRKAKYDLDEDEIKPYFELKSVLENGVFFAAEKLYGLTFKERFDLPTYHPDVRVFEVFEEDGSPLALFYGDFYKRDNKNGGAWMGNFVGQSKLLGTKPVIYNVCNYTKPAPGEPALISFDEVTTLFHEFGHALHGLFADQKFPSLSGTSVARDFVEFPSQINEHWALYPEVLNNYAKHYATGEVIPAALLDKIKKAATFNQGYALTELLAAANLDLEWHKLSADQPLQNVDSFEIQALRKTKLLLSEVPPRYRSSYFLHIWSNGYAASYYAYLWTEMLDHDAYAWFEENGGLTRANGQRFRDMILSRGNTEDFGEMFRKFRGRDPKIDRMLLHRGLTTK